MSWFSSLVKGAGHVAGKVLGNPLIDAGISFIPGVGGLLSHIPGVGGLLKGVVDKVGSDPLGALGGVNSALDAQHARDLQGQAESLAKDNYAQRAPLRQAGVQGLLNPAVPDLSGVGYNSPNSVYGKKKPLLPPAAGGP